MASINEWQVAKAVPLLKIYRNSESIVVWLRDILKWPLFHKIISNTIFTVSYCLNEKKKTKIGNFTNDVL